MTLPSDTREAVVARIMQRLRAMPTDETTLRDALAEAYDAGRVSAQPAPAKPRSAKPPRDRRSVRVHLAKADYVSEDHNVVARCGRRGRVESLSGKPFAWADDVEECTTVLGDIIEVTMDPTQATCATCLRSAKQ